MSLVAGPAGLGKTALVLHVIHDRFPDRVGGALLVDIRADDPVAHVRQEMVDQRLRARQYTRDHGQDAPEIVNWVWPH